MIDRIDRGEKLARAVADLIDTHEAWDTAQFTRKADAEWASYLEALEQVNQISLDFYF